MPQDPDTSPTRRQVLAGAAATGVAVAAGAGLAESASAAPPPAPATSNPDAVVAHVSDPRSGRIDLYVGERHVAIRDPDLAARLSSAAH